MSDKETGRSCSHHSVPDATLWPPWKKKNALLHHLGQMFNPCVVTLTTATHARCQKCVIFTPSGGKYQSQNNHPPWKDRAELHLRGFDVVRAGRQHAQIPVIPDTKTVLHCLIGADTPPTAPLLPLGSVVPVQEKWHYRTETVSIRDSLSQDWKLKPHQAGSYISRLGRESSSRLIKDRVQRVLFLWAQMCWINHFPRT